MIFGGQPQISQSSFIPLFKKSPNPFSCNINIFQGRFYQQGGDMFGSNFYPEIDLGSLFTDIVHSIGAGGNLWTVLHSTLWPCQCIQESGFMAPRWALHGFTKACWRKTHQSGSISLAFSAELELVLGIKSTQKQTGKNLLIIMFCNELHV